MKRIIKPIAVFALCVSFAQCDDYLNVSSPSNTDDEFVTSTPAEAFKTLSWAYAEYCYNAASGGNYNWCDPVGSDAELYPEYNSANNVNAMLLPESETVGAKQTQFNSLYNVIARSSRVATIIAGKDEYKADKEAGRVSDWTQLYGEAMTLRAFCYFELVKHFGDVPYGIENSVVSDYALTSRFDIYDNIIASLKEVEPLMREIGDGITAERMTRTFANALIGEAALYAGGYQTIRTDVPGLYGDVTFITKGVEANGCVYARRADYLEYYKIAETYFTAALTTHAGTAKLITTDDRAEADNPFQLHFQYIHNLEISPESLLEIANLQTNQSEHPYSQGRPSNGGGSNAAPCKVFGAIRIIPTFYYTGYADDDKRRDVSMTVTGSSGDGNESLLSFTPGSKLSGGISINKWDDNRMNPPYVTSQRNSGMNYVTLRMADAMLMLAEVKAELGTDNAGAIGLVNQIRKRAFGDDNHNLSGISGEELKDAIWAERKLELLGEGDIRWDMIRSGKFTERALAVRAEMKEMIAGLEADGYYTFSNGKTISNYVWIKSVKKENPLTFAADPTDPALYPGWRGQYDYTKIDAVKGKVKGDKHNLAIKGLFEYIDPNGAVAKTLEADGYVRTDWGITIVENKNTIYDRNILSGIGSADAAPRYYHPIPFETINQSKGKVTNGYGLPQQ